MDSFYCLLEFLRVSVHRVPIRSLTPAHRDLRLMWVRGGFDRVRPARCVRGRLGVTSWTGGSVTPQVIIQSTWRNGKWYTPNRSLPVLTLNSYVFRWKGGNFQTKGVRFWGGTTETEETLTSPSHLSKSPRVPWSEPYSPDCKLKYIFLNDTWCKTAAFALSKVSSTCSPKAQLKRRTGGGGAGGRVETDEAKGREERGSQQEEVAPSPTQLSRSPRSAAHLAGAARVLPPLGGTDGG